MVAQPDPQADSTFSDIDQRHLKRIKLMQNLFAYTFDEGKQQQASEQATKKQIEQTLPKGYRLPQDKDLQPQIESIYQDLPKIDAQLQKYAPERPLSDINLVDLAILRLIVWEAHHKNTPKKVLIDEAVELAKEFGSDSSPRFVNGVLGQLLMQENNKK
jgi:N utilization substance protein B